MNTLSSSFVLLLLLLSLTSIHGAQDEFSLSRMFKSIDQTCNDIHSLLTYQRKIIDIQVTNEAPLRLKINIELTSPSSPTLKQNFSVEGMVCHHGFDRNAAEAACRSQKKKLQMFSTGFEWNAAPGDLHEKCYFIYNNDPFIVPCEFVLDNFSCASGSASLNDCAYGPLFQHQCTKKMHVGIACSGTYVPPTTTTTTEQTSTTTTSSDEQTVTDVLNRHNWTDIGAVIDVTGSMSGCYSQIDQWISLSDKTKLVQYFVFFNDGDDAPDSNKVIGSTGGIYSVYSEEGVTKVLSVLNTAKTNGGGGDGPENDIEAILYAIANCSTCENIIHIADNGATPRDLVLLSQVTKPIKVILCRVTDSGYINPKLLDIAYQTGGSLHTLDSDIETLGSLQLNDTIQIGTGTYRLESTGFVRII